MVDVRNIFWVKKKFANEIHTEYYFNNSIWGKIKKKAKTEKNLVWYIMTPVNYEYFRHYFGTRLPKEKLDKIMSTRAKWLAKNTKIGLHIHFWRFGRMTFSEKDRMFKEAISWGKKNSIDFDKFVPGWMQQHHDIEKLCKKYNLKLSKKKIFLHDYEL